MSVQGVSSPAPVLAPEIPPGRGAPAQAKSGLAAAKRRRFAWMMAAPAVALLVAMTIFPLLYSAVVSLTNLELGTPQQLRFVGIANYTRALFHDERFFNAITNTAYLMVLSLATQLPLGYLIASLLYRVGGPMRAVVLCLILIPSVISQVVAGWQGRMIFNAATGPLNYLLGRIGIAAPSWLASPHTSLLTVYMTDTWQSTPFIALIILTALQAIPLDTIEAAKIDGAAGWSMFRSIIVPAILPIVAVGVMLRGIDLFKMFDLVLILTQGGPGSSSETLAYYTYIQGFKSFSPAYTAALSFIQLLLVTIVAKIYLRSLNRAAPRA